MKPIEKYSDTELLVIIREAVNSNVPGSLYQRANSEWQIRQQQKILDAAKNGRGGIFFEVGGDMINDATIHTDVGAHIGIAVAGNYSSKKGKIIQGNKNPEDTPWYLTWWMKYIGYPLLVALIAGVILLLFSERNSTASASSSQYSIVTMPVSVL